MNIKRKIIAAATQRIIGQLALDELTAVYKAEQNAWYASQQLGISAQCAAQDVSRTLVREIVEGLSQYKVDQIEHNLKLAARDLAKYTAEVTK